MKRNKKINMLIICVYIILILSMTYFEFAMERAVEVSSIFLIFTFLILFETGEFNSKTMCVIATLSALGGFLRIPFAIIPGFQPVTFLCAVTGYTLGPISGFMVGFMSVFISNFFLGHGPWTLWQILGWGLCGMFFGIFRSCIKKFGFKSFVILCGIWGYIYGFILNQWYVLEFMRPITLKVILSGSILSFGHDTSHAIGNIIFASFFGRSFIQVLERYNKKNMVVRIKKHEENLIKN